MDHPQPPAQDDDKSANMGGGISLILAIVFTVSLIHPVAIIWAQ